MDENPNQPGDEPAHAEPPALQYREVLADHRHVAQIEVAEWMLRFSSLEMSRNHASDIASLLNRGLSHTRHRLAIQLEAGEIAGDEHFGMTGQAQVRRHTHTPGAG